MPAFRRTDKADTDYGEITTHDNVTDLDHWLSGIFFLTPQRLRYLKANDRSPVRRGIDYTTHFPFCGEKTICSNPIIDFYSTKHDLFISHWHGRKIA